ncbi:MAG: HD domain-containing protein [Flavobacteriales bacterium]|jgi:uncharacterized protein|nr:HD domain-containing protein [Flavobacteriales bacterium]
MEQSKEEFLSIIRNEIQSIFEGEGSGHDWWHIYRVTETAKSIARQEQANIFLVELAALLHDLGDHKLFDDSQEKLIGELLQKHHCPNNLITEVLNIVKSVSYKGAHVKTTPLTLEGKIVQDADRLDAIGAIGIARAFAYGGHHNRLMYHPEQTPELHDNFESYKNSKGHTINHFYEKLLLLKDRMQTQTGKELAKKRHQYMESFLQQFYLEWNGQLDSI